MFQISESIADLIEGTNYKYVIVEKNKVIHTNLQITDEIQNELRNTKEHEKKTLSKRTRHIIKQKFVHSIQWGNFEVCIFTNKKICPIVNTLFNCIMKLIIESAESDYKNHYFYKEPNFTE